MRYFCITDVESNGLFGQPYAVGCVVLDEHARIVDGFEGHCPIEEPLDDFVQEHPLPASSAKFPGLGHLIRAFLAFDRAIQEQCAPESWVDVGFPVESRFFETCKRYDPTWKTPCPLYDVATIMLSRGFDENRLREDFVLDWAEESMSSRKVHDPLRDAYFSGLCMLRCRHLLR